MSALFFDLVVETVHKIINKGLKISDLEDEKRV